MMLAADRFAQQRQVADDVQHLVPHKLLAISQRLRRQHRVVADDHGVLQAAALDEAVLEQKFNLLVKTKRPRVRQLLLPRFRRDLGGIKLRERPCLSALVQVILKFSSGNNVITVSPWRISIGSVGVKNSRFSACGATPAAARICRTPANSRPDGRLVGVQLHDGVVNFEARQRREDMFHRVDFHVALGECSWNGSCPPHFPRVPRSPVCRPNPRAETHAAVGRCGQDGHVHRGCRCAGDAGKAGGTIESLLIEHARLNKPRAHWQEGFQLQRRNQPPRRRNARTIHLSEAGSQKNLTPDFQLILIKPWRLGG